MLSLDKDRDGNMTQKSIEKEISKQLFQALNKIEKLEKNCIQLTMLLMI